MTHPKAGRQEVVIGGGTEHLCRHRFTLCEFGGDEDAASSQADGRSGQRQRGRQEAVNEGDGEGEHGLVAAAITANLQTQATGVKAAAATNVKISVKHDGVH